MEPKCSEGGSLTPIRQERVGLPLEEGAAENQLQVTYARRSCETLRGYDWVYLSGLHVKLNFCQQITTRL